jgi:hypothetical protein
MTLVRCQKCMSKFELRTRDGYGEHAEPFPLEAWVCALVKGARAMSLT